MKAGPAPREHHRSSPRPPPPLVALSTSDPGNASERGENGAAALTCLEFASSRFRSHREAALRSQQVRWCWHPEAAVRAGRGTGLGSAWLALHSAAAPAAAGADWPARALHTLRGRLAGSFNWGEADKSEIKGKPALRWTCGKNPQLGLLWLATWKQAASLRGQVMAVVSMHGRMGVHRKCCQKARSESHIFKKGNSAALANFIPFLTIQSLSSYGAAVFNKRQTFINTCFPFGLQLVLRNHSKP